MAAADAEAVTPVAEESAGGEGAEVPIDAVDANDPTNDGTDVTATEEDAAAGGAPDDAAAEEGGAAAAHSWAAQWDEASNQTYYYCSITGETSWEVPDGYNPPPDEGGEDGGTWADDPTADAAAAASEWQMIEDDLTGDVYYYNATTEETSWDVPEGFVPPEEAAEEAGWDDYGEDGYGGGEDGGWGWGEEEGGYDEVAADDVGEGDDDEADEADGAAGADINSRGAWKRRKAKGVATGRRVGGKGSLWQEMEDSALKRVFYVHSKSGVAQWAYPADVQKGALFGILHRESDWLKMVYLRMGGDDWVRRDGWGEKGPQGGVAKIPDSMAGLFGVGVREGCVTDLNLSSNGLTGDLEKAGQAIGELVQLRSLRLGGNKLTGRLPLWLGKLAELRVLMLNDNKLAGGIPPPLVQLPKLQQLHLHRNRIVGVIPPEIVKLSSLQVLDLGQNKLSGPLPPKLSRMKALEVLSVYQNRLTGAIPKLPRSRHLRILRLDRNDFNGPIPPSLARRPGLERVYLDSNNFSGTVPPGIPGLQNLRRLRLGHNKLLNGSLGGNGGLIDDASLIAAPHPSPSASSAPPPITMGPTNGPTDATVPVQMLNLRTLDVSHSRIAGNVPLNMARLPHLHDLYLGDNKLRGPLPAVGAEPMKRWHAKQVFAVLKGLRVEASDTTGGAATGAPLDEILKAQEAAGDDGAFIAATAEEAAARKIVGKREVLSAVRRLGAGEAARGFSPLLGGLLRPRTFSKTFEDIGRASENGGITMHDITSWVGRIERAGELPDFLKPKAVPLRKDFSKC